MSTIQEILVIALRKMASDVEIGKYGEGDDIDYDAFCEDIEEDVTDVAE